MSTTRRLLAGVLVAGLVSVGGAGVAYAANGNPANPSQATTAPEREREFCDKWVAQLPRLEDARVQSERQIDALHKAIEQARDHHRDELLLRLEHELDNVQRAHDRLVDLINRIHARCDAH